MAKNRLADWDTTAANNTDVGGINIDEGWAPENVNNAARETMSQLAEFFKDSTGTITSTNVANAYSITTNDGVAAYAAGQMYAFIVNAANTGATTLNVNTIGAKSVTHPGGTALAGNEFVANQIAIVAYEATNDVFILLSAAGNTFVLDEDDMASDSDTDIATQQSVKAYVDGSPLLGTAQATTSGSSKVFGSIPSNATRIQVLFAGVSLSDNSNPVVQLGTSAGLTTTGYLSSCGHMDNVGGTLVSDDTTGFVVRLGLNTRAISGIMDIMNIDGNQWVYSFAGGNGGTLAHSGGGQVTLSDTLTQVALVTTATFDEGKVNVSWG